MHKILYEGQDLSLSVLHEGHPVSLITFEPRNMALRGGETGKFGPGNGKGVFAPLGMNEFIIHRNRNHWYQTPEILPVIALINRLTQGSRILTYGGSMGGFAAINFAPLLQADCFIATSPLFDMAADNALNEHRWAEDRIGLDFAHNHIRAGRCKAAKGVVLYDKHHRDAQHAAAIARETQALLLPLDYGDHPCSFYLNDTYQLKYLVTELAEDRFSLDGFYQRLAEKTAASHYPKQRQAQQALAQGNFDAALAAADAALELQAQAHLCHFYRGEALLQKGAILAAIEAYHRALQIKPQNPRYKLRLTEAYNAQANEA